MVSPTASWMVRTLQMKNSSRASSADRGYHAVRLERRAARTRSCVSELPQTCSGTCSGARAID